VWVQRGGQPSTAATTTTSIGVVVANCPGATQARCDDHTRLPNRAGLVGGWPSCQPRSTSISRHGHRGTGASSTAAVRPMEVLPSAFFFNSAGHIPRPSPQLLSATSTMPYNVVTAVIMKQPDGVPREDGRRREPQRFHSRSRLAWQQIRTQNGKIHCPFYVSDESEAHLPHPEPQNPCGISRHTPLPFAHPSLRTPPHTLETGHTLGVVLGVNTGRATLGAGVGWLLPWMLLAAYRHHIQIGADGGAP